MIFLRLYYDWVRCPYESLHDGIMKFSRLRDILLLDDFNARTGDKQVGLLKFVEDPIIVPKIDPTENGTTSYAVVAPLVIGYGHHLLELWALMT